MNKKFENMKDLYPISKKSKPLFKGVTAKKIQAKEKMTKLKSGTSDITENQGFSVPRGTQHADNQTHTAMNTKEFIFGTDREEAEAILIGLYGSSAKPQNLKEVPYTIFE